LDRDTELELLKTLLADAEARAEEADVVKRTFLLNMSHELLTPLNAIIGYSDMLLEEAQDLGEDREVFVTDLEKISTSGRNLLSLVSEVLEMSKIESGDAEMHLEEVDLHKLLADVGHSVKEHVEARNNELILLVDPSVPLMFTDRTMVRQTLLELVRNASVFTRDGRIEVIAEVAGMADGAGISVVVRDNGVGIDSREQELIFDSFRQVDSTTTREQGGAGLGLALCREFCRRLRGDLTVRSTPGEGSEFTIMLPVASSATRIEEILPMDILDLWASMESDVQAAATLEEAAQALATGLHTRLSESAALTRVFVTVDLAEVPDEIRSFVTALADMSGATDDLHDSTQVLSLIGTSGREPDWNDRHRSQNHSGIPLISAEFVEDIPMISSLLHAVGLPLDYMDPEKAKVIQQTIGESAGLFFVESAALDTDHLGRKIIPAQDFVNQYGVRSVFGLSVAYSGDEILVVIVFCTEQFSKAVAERFLPLVTLFKGATASLLSEGRIFAK
jgi:nitrogen-specific signal transduction histidine kinase